MEVNVLQNHGVITVRTPYCKTMLFLDSYVEMEQRLFITTKLCSLSYYYDRLADQSRLINYDVDKQLRSNSKLIVEYFRAEENGYTVISDNSQAVQFMIDNAEKIENLLRCYDIKLGPLYDDEYNDYYSFDPDIEMDPRYKNLIELHFRIKSFFDGDITQERLDEMCTIPFTKSARN